MRLHCTILALALLAIGCGTTRPKGAGSNPAPAVAADGSENPTEAVPLEFVMTDQTTTGRIMHLRGRILNPHEEGVQGVRLQLVFLAPREEGGSRVLEIQQKELEVTLAPGESTVLRWDVESLYLSPGFFALAAYPRRLGDRDLPPPDHRKE